MRAEARQQTARARRAGRDYCYELRDGKRTIAAGQLSRAVPVEVGDVVDVVGLSGIVESVVPARGSHELLLVVQLQETRRAPSVLSR
ncbi:MAG TPA: hypothetical protein VGP69_11715 [Gaiellaceae bacterium]|nr:hypothetical protein [Gaiellaceae bacterium]